MKLAVTAGFLMRSPLACSVTGRPAAFPSARDYPTVTLRDLATGGYSNGTDDWRLFTAQDPISQGPLLVKFKAGKNTLRLTNSNGLAANLDYLVISSPDVKPARLNNARP